METLLDITGLDTAYGSSQVLFGLNLRIPAGGVATLLGRNGMGKTTTVRSILGLTPARSGSIRFRGERIDQLSPDRIARMGVAVVPEGRQIFPNLTVLENLKAFAAQRNASPTPWTLERIYALFPVLEQRARNMGNQLSGGEQQMLAIGRALMTNPHLLILDEATEGLAPQIVAEIWRVVEAIRNDGIATLIVDRDYRKVAAQAERLVVLLKGEVVLAGAAAELRHGEALAGFLGL